MQSIRFLTDYRGIHTAERFFTAGDVVSLRDKQADALVAAGRAEVVQAKRKTAPPPAPVRKKSS